MYDRLAYVNYYRLIITIFKAITIKLRKRAYVYKVEKQQRTVQRKNYYEGNLIYATIQFTIIREISQNTIKPFYLDFTWQMKLQLNPSITPKPMKS